MPDRPGTDMSHEHQWRHGAEWKEQADDWGPIKENKMTDRVDRERVLPFKKGDFDNLRLPHLKRMLALERNERIALLAERDALEAENQRLGDGLEAAATALDWAKHHLKEVGVESAQVSGTIPEVRAALAEQEKIDDQ